MLTMGVENACIQSRPYRTSHITVPFSSGGAAVITRRILFARLALVLASIAAAIGGVSRIEIAEAKKRRGRRNKNPY